MPDLNSRFDETSWRRRKHLTYFLKREGFVRDKEFTCFYKEVGFAEVEAEKPRTLPQLWNRTSGNITEKILIQKFDRAHRDIVRGLVRGKDSPKLNEESNKLFTPDDSIVYTLTPRFTVE
ncbi:MAG: hypothetical protein WBK55_03705 [Alphaproteobacteria bacterium]